MGELIEIIGRFAEYLLTIFGLPAAAVFFGGWTVKWFYEAKRSAVTGPIYQEEGFLNGILLRIPRGDPIAEQGQHKFVHEYLFNKDVRIYGPIFQ